MITTLSWRLTDDTGAAGLLVVPVELPGGGPLPADCIKRHKGLPERLAHAVAGRKRQPRPPVGSPVPPQSVSP